MKGALTLRPREHRLAFIAGVLIICWGVISFVVQPMWDMRRSLQLQVDTQMEKVAALHKSLAHAPAVERNYQAIAAYLETASDEQASGLFLGELESMGRRAGVQLGLKQRPKKPDEKLSRFEVELDIEGSQSQALSFLDALFRVPRLIVIERLRLATVPGKEGALRADLVVQKLTLRK